MKGFNLKASVTEPLLSLKGAPLAERIAAEAARFREAGVPADALKALVNTSKRLAFGAKNPEQLTAKDWPVLHRTLTDAASAHEFLEAWTADVLRREVQNRESLGGFARVTARLMQRLALADGLMSANRASDRGTLR